MHRSTSVFFSLQLSRFTLRRNSFTSFPARHFHIITFCRDCIGPGSGRTTWHCIQLVRSGSHAILSVSFILTLTFPACPSVLPRRWRQLMYPKRQLNTTEQNGKRRQASLCIPSSVHIKFNEAKYFNGRSRWTRGLQCGSAAFRLLGLWDRIPPAPWRSIVSAVGCQVEVSASG